MNVTMSHLHLYFSNSIYAYLCSLLHLSCGKTHILHPAPPHIQTEAAWTQIVYAHWCLGTLVTLHKLTRNKGKKKTHLTVLP